MEPVFCPKCGQKHSHDYLHCYCPGCGARITVRQHVPQLVENKTKDFKSRVVNAQKVFTYGLLSSIIALRFLWLMFNPRPGTANVLFELLLIVIGPSMGVVGLWRMSKSQVVGNKYVKVFAWVFLWVGAVIGGLILAFMGLLILVGG